VLNLDIYHYYSSLNNKNNNSIMSFSKINNMKCFFCKKSGCNEKNPNGQFICKVLENKKTNSSCFFCKGSNCTEKNEEGLFICSVIEEKNKSCFFCKGPDCDGVDQKGKRICNVLRQRKTERDTSGCSYCGCVGHLHWECKDNIQTNMFCRDCKNKGKLPIIFKGHNKNNCPSIKQAEETPKPKKVEKPKLEEPWIHVPVKCDYLNKLKSGIVS
jgi:hypothetical protein